MFASLHSYISLIWGLPTSIQIKFQFLFSFLYTNVLNKYSPYHLLSNLNWPNLALIFKLWPTILLFLQVETTSQGSELLFKSSFKFHFHIFSFPPSLPLYCILTIHYCVKRLKLIGLGLHPSNWLVAWILVTSCQ